jgi:hypothetical protein
MSQAVAPAGVRWRLGAGTRKSVLLIHIASAGAWLGIDVVMAVLVFTAVFSDDDRTKALSFQALELIAVWPLLITGLVCLLTGGLLGLGSKYGLVRYWWVAVKLVLNVILVALVAFALRPGLAEAAAYGEVLAAGGSARSDVGSLVFPPVVSGVALVTATVLSVFKPWGRLRRRQ